jgi:hypothetical protein
MIKFFRKIRQRLLTENKVSKYLIYAIGEIVLVVIGILIALQINTWNQLKNDRLEEKEILARIEKDLQSDLADLERQTDRNKILKKDLEFIIDGIVKKNLTLTDFVEKNRSIGTNTYFDQVNSTYNESIASGKISLIENDSLRDKILRHYEVNEIGIDANLKHHMENFIFPTFYNAFGHTKEYVQFVTRKPNNLESVNLNLVYNHKGYLSAISTKLGLLNGQDRQFNFQKRRIEILLESIKIEFNHKWP